MPDRKTYPMFKIPNGKFGLVLKDGTKMIGVPAKSWFATIQAEFGMATIPREQISSIGVANGGVRIHLTNGDRVSGRLTSPVMQFETSYGLMTVGAADLIKMGTATSFFIRARQEAMETNRRAIQPIRQNRSHPTSVDSKPIKFFPKLPLR